MKIGLLGLLWVIFGVVSVSCWAKPDFLRESYTPLWVCSGQKCTKLLDFLMFFKLNFWVTENFELWAKIVKRKCSQLLIACSIWNTSFNVRHYASKLTHWWNGALKNALFAHLSLPWSIGWVALSFLVRSFVGPAMVTSQLLLVSDPQTHTFSDSLW